MQWTFFYTSQYTKIGAFVVNRVPVGATVAVTCRGGGCPFARRINTVRKNKRCQSGSNHTCRPQRQQTIDLQPAFRNDHLRVGAQVAVRVTRPRWIGKYYLFTAREGRGPLISIDCLAPLAAAPGVGC